MLSKSLKKLALLFQLALKGQGGAALKELALHVHSTEKSILLRRNLDVPFETPEAKIPLDVRPFASEDADELLEDNELADSPEATMQRARRKSLIEKGVPTCYVAVTEDGHPIYMQWLIGHEQNDAIQSHFSGGFPILKDDEALLELAFTREDYRGNRVMQHAMARIAKKGTELGAKFVLTFVEADNVPSLKACERAGFSPYAVRTDRWRFFQRHSEFETLPESSSA